MTDMILGEFEQMVLLGILEEGSEAFALEVRRWIKKETGREVSRGAFYTALERLREKGMVTWEAYQPPDARRKGTQRLFSVTPAGLQALNHTRSNLQARWLRIERGLQGS